MMFDWLTTEVWEGIGEWREFIGSLLHLGHRDHLCYIISFTSYRYYMELELVLTLMKRC